MAPQAQPWAKIEEIFHQALEQDPETRDAWLDNACGGDASLRSEVAALLESDAAAREGFVAGNVQRAVRNLADTQTGERPRIEGRMIGQWRLLREIGHGGMGSVYLVERADQQYESQAAIKLVRQGLDTDFILRRFRRERQILARLDHPNITKMFDGGTTEDGIPYLVMEFIDGLWITKYAEKHGLSTEQRVGLLLPVCSALAYAHRNFIVHRDMKPGNILIDATGIPKLLDFGISKLLLTDRPELPNTQGGAMMTPDYASPEQILGEPVTIASDVYSLGAVLYELLTGVRPHRIDQCTPLALERAICLDPVRVPSAAVGENRTLARRLRGDLDNIVLRAMQKEPERRYASVEQLADDLRRYLDHRPVLARPDSVTYRIGRFIRRNRVAVALGAAVAVALLAGATVAIREERIAHERFEDVRKLATTFLFGVEEAARPLPGSLRLRQQIARTGVEYLTNLSRGSTGDWALKRELADAWLRIGVVQGGQESSNLGDLPAALASFSSAGKLLDEVLEHDPGDAQASYSRVAVLYETSDLERVSGHYKEAADAAESGLRIAESLMARVPKNIDDPKNLDLVRYAGLLHLDLVRVRQQKGELEQGQLEAESGARLLRRVADARPEDRDVQLSLADLDARMGSLQASLGHPADALASYRSEAEILEALRARLPNDTRSRRELMFAYGHIGDTLGNPEYDNLGDLPGAFAAYEKMAEQAKFLSDAAPADARALGDYGIALLRLGLATPPAGTLRRETLERSLDLLTRAETRVPQSRMIATHKVWAETELGDYQSAITTGERILKGAPDDALTFRRMEAAVGALAREQARNGRRADALATLDHSLAWAKKFDDTAPPASIAIRPGVAQAWQTAGAVYAMLADGEGGQRAAEDRETALAWYRRSLDQWKKLEGQKGFLPLYAAAMEAAGRAMATIGAQDKGVRR